MLYYNYLIFNKGMKNETKNINIYNLMGIAISYISFTRSVKSQLVVMPINLL